MDDIHRENRDSIKGSPAAAEISASDIDRRAGAKDWSLAATRNRRSTANLPRNVPMFPCD
jgi:hypothetical protein